MKVSSQIQLKLFLVAASFILARQLNKLMVLSNNGATLLADSRDNTSLSDDDDGYGDAPTLVETNATIDNDTQMKRLPWTLPKARPAQQSSVEFMDELNQMKRGMNISLPWDTNASLPTPIISLNLPKSATLTLSEYFKCGGLTGAHTWIPGRPKGEQVRVGDCMLNNFLAGAPPFRGCDVDDRTQRTIEHYSDIGMQGPYRCYYSSLHDGGLDQIAKHYPTATIFMMPRPTVQWINSVGKWGGGRLFGT